MTEESKQPKRVFGSESFLSERGGFGSPESRDWSDARVWAFDDGVVWFELYTGFVNATANGSAAYMRKLGESLVAAADATEKAVREKAREADPAVAP